MPERQLTNRTHVCVYVCVKEDRVNVARSCLGLTRGMRVCEDSIIRHRQNAEMARMCVFAGACTGKGLGHMFVVDVWKYEEVKVCLHA